MHVAVREKQISRMARERVVPGWRRRRAVRRVSGGGGEGDFEAGRKALKERS